MLKYRLIFGPILIALLVGVFCADHWLDQTYRIKGLALLGLAGVAVFMAGLEFARFLNGLGIRHVGGTVAEALSAAFGSLTALEAAAAAEPPQSSTADAGPYARQSCCLPEHRMATAGQQ